MCNEVTKSRTDSSAILKKLLNLFRHFLKYDSFSNTKKILHHHALFKEQFETTK